MPDSTQAAGGGRRQAAECPRLSKTDISRRSQAAICGMARIWTTLANQMDRLAAPHTGISGSVTTSVCRPPARSLLPRSEHLPRAVGRLLTYTRSRVIADTLREERLQLSSLSGREPYLI